MGRKFVKKEHATMPRKCNATAKTRLNYINRYLNNYLSAGLLRQHEASQDSTNRDYEAGGAVAPRGGVLEVGVAGGAGRRAGRDDSDPRGRREGGDAAVGQCRGQRLSHGARGGDGAGGDGLLGDGGSNRSGRLFFCNSVSK